MRGKWPVALVLVVGLLLPVGAVAADHPSPTARTSDFAGPDFRVSSSGATADEQFPAVAYNPVADEYLVVWQDSRHATTHGWDIYGRRLAPDGSPLGKEFRVTRSPSYERLPAVAYNQVDDEYLVVWVDSRNHPSRGLDLYGRRLATDGSRLGGVFRVSGTGATANEWAPDVVHNPIDNQYLVVWEDFRSEATLGMDVYARRLTAAGSRLGADLRLSGPGGLEDEWTPDVAHNPATNRYLAVWGTDLDSESATEQIHGQHLTAGGALLGSVFRVDHGSLGVTSSGLPALAYVPSGNYQFLVVWEGWDGAAANRWSIYGSRVSGLGGAVGEDFPISGPGTPGAEWAPALAYDPAARQLLVVWQDDRWGATRGDQIVGRRLSELGVPTGPAFLIGGSATSADDEFPVVAANPTHGQYLVVWQDARSLASRGWDIHGRIVEG